MILDPRTVHPSLLWQLLACDFNFQAMIVIPWGERGFKGTRLWCSGFLVRGQLIPAISLPLNKALYSNCFLVQRSHKGIGSIWSTFHTLFNVKECHGGTATTGAGNQVLLGTYFHMCIYKLLHGVTWINFVKQKTNFHQKAKTSYRKLVTPS